MKAVLLFCSITAAIETHPFVGKHLNSDVVHHENGLISIRLEGKSST